MDKISLSDAFAVLIPLVGSGGVGAIIAAYFGFRRGRSQTEPSMQIAALYSDRYLIERLAAAIERLGTAEERLGTAFDNNTNSVQGLSRAYQDRPR
jgi:hypothetical protein